MYQCDHHDVYCTETEYYIHDRIVENELLDSITADEILNQSNFCCSIPVDFINQNRDDIDTLSENEMLKGLTNGEGIYHLFVEDFKCDDHEIAQLRCIYVGISGSDAKGRVLTHIREKWIEKGGVSAAYCLYVGFYSMPHRLAKYYEQVFLESYDFIWNTKDNTGTVPLYGRWDYERYEQGTELYVHASVWAKKVGMEDEE